MSLKNLTGVHLETKQLHWHIWRYVSESFFQLKQLKHAFSVITIVTICLSLVCETGCNWCS